MNVIVTIRDQDHVMTMIEAKRFSDRMVTVECNTIEVQGEIIDIDRTEARMLHRQINEALYPKTKGKQ